MTYTEGDYMQPLFIELTCADGERRTFNINLICGFESYGKSSVIYTNHREFPVIESYETIKNTIIEMKKVF